MPHAMKAMLPSADTSNGQNWSGEKEEVSCWRVVAVHKGKIINPVTVRCWMGRSKSASVVYAAIWAHGPSRSYAGHGQAGGYGYHKESAAIDGAIESAGITLWGSPYLNRDEAPDFKKRARIDGVGDSAIREALSAIARALGYRKFEII